MITYDEYEKALKIVYEYKTQLETITYDENQKALKIVYDYKTQLETHLKKVERLLKEVEKEIRNNISKFANINKEMNIYDTELSVRLNNILHVNCEEFGFGSYCEGFKVKELENLSIRKFLQCRQTGIVLLKELKELCFYAGISLQP